MPTSLHSSPLPRLGSIVVALFALCLASAVRAAQPGQLDLTFRSGEAIDDSVFTALVQPDKKILIAGEFRVVRSAARAGIARLNANGTLDPTFDPGFGFGGGGEAFAFARQTDGKIFIGGSFDFYNQTSRSNLARLQADGSLDFGFDPGTGTDGEVLALAVLPGGELLLAGAFTTYDGSSRNRIALVTPSGALSNPTVFNPGSGANNAIRALARQPDGKILVAGSFTTFNGTGRSRIARLNANGSLDPTFAPTGLGADSTVRALLLQPDGKIILVGDFGSVGGVSRVGIARLDSTGALDPTFNPGVGVNDEINSVGLLPGGKLAITGSFTTYNNLDAPGVARLNANGSLDNTFAVGTGLDGRGFGLTVLSDGKILVAGSFAQVNKLARANLARLSATGAPDLAFGAAEGFDDSISALVRQPDGKLVVAGSFGAYDGTPCGRIARVNADGTLDRSFNPGGSGADGSILALVRLPDGKLLVGGGFTAFNGTPRARLARLLADGKLDPAFDPGAGPNADILALAVQADGRVVLGGAFATFGGSARNRIARLNTNGSLDGSFDPGAGANGSVNALTLQPDGGILAGGAFTTYDGTARNRVVRIEPDGDVDPTFTPGAGANSLVNALALDPQGRIVIGGEFTSYDGTARNRVARLLETGALDLGFSSGAGANSAVKTILLQSDGTVLIGGTFGSVGGFARPSLARLLSDGALDTGFDPAAGANLGIQAMALQPDGRIVIAGDFDTYAGVSRPFLARVHGDFAFAARAYAGLLHPDDFVSRPVGSARFQLSRDGAFTGTLVQGAVTIPLRGVFGADGRAFQVVLSKGVRYQLDVQFGRDDDETDRITGTLVTPEGVELIDAFPAGFDAKTRPAVQFRGDYVNFFFGGAGATSAPDGGAGFTLKVGLDGSARFTGFLADGTPFTATTFLDASGEIHFHAPLFKGLGHFSGIIGIDSSTSGRNVEGFAIHRRPVGPGLLYPAGFVADGSIVGRLHRRAVGVPPIGLLNSPGNARLVVRAGNLAADLLQTLTVGANHRATAVSPLDAGLRNLSLTFNAATGAFTGSFIPAGQSKAVTMRGVFFNDEKVAAGFVLVPSSTPGGPTLSSIVQISPQ